MTSAPLVTIDRDVLMVRHRLTKDGPPEMGRPLLIDPAKAAVVIVDVQRYFVETPPFSAMQAILRPLAAARCWSHIGAREFDADVPVRLTSRQASRGLHVPYNFETDCTAM